MLHSMRSLHLAIWLLAGYALAAPCILRSTGTGCDIQSRSSKYSASDLSAVASKFGSWPGSSPIEKRREHEHEHEHVTIDDDGDVEEFSEDDSAPGGFNSDFEVDEDDDGDFRVDDIDANNR